MNMAACGLVVMDGQRAMKLHTKQASIDASTGFQIVNSAPPIGKTPLVSEPHALHSSDEILPILTDPSWHWGRAIFAQ